MSRINEELAQRRIDEVRIRSMFAAMISHAENGVWWRMMAYYLWWPEPTPHKYEMRQLPVPSDTDRPPWLKGKRLVVDLSRVPVEVWRAIREQRKKAKKHSSGPTKMGAVMTDEGIMWAKKLVEERGLLPLQ